MKMLLILFMHSQNYRLCSRIQSFTLGYPILMRKTFSMAILALALAGCDAMTQTVADIGASPDTKEPTIVLAAGHRVYIDDMVVPIQGFDVCPVDGGVFGPRADAGQLGCVVIDDTRTEIPVRLALPTGLKEEVWAVVRIQQKTTGGRTYERMYLRRPDRSMVVAAP